jgi:asparagine synthetase A
MTKSVVYVHRWSEEELHHRRSRSVAFFAEALSYVADAIGVHVSETAHSQTFETYNRLPREIN